MHLLTRQHYLQQGRAYWEVRLTTGKIWSELDIVSDPLRGRHGRRPINWHLDLVATGDVRRIQELWLHTPNGPVALQIFQPGTAYQFSSGALALDQGRQQLAQIIGRVDDRAHGTGVAFIWDLVTRQVYRDDSANVTCFASWRPGIVAPGCLALDALGIVL
jgi:hypothetical protein